MTVAAKPRLAAAAAAALLVVGAAVGGVLFRDRSGEYPQRPAGERPRLLLLTSLPILFPEDFNLERSGSPALSSLETRYSVAPVSIADSRSLDGKRLLMMAQPQAQPAEALVDLDQWVRKGGRVLLLADPLLEWPSRRPLGDLLRPPVEFADTGLLGHWGLRLDAPESPGRAKVAVDGRTVTARSPGSLVATGANCQVTARGLIARCTIGKGRATVIADADLLNAAEIDGVEGSPNLALVLGELDRLEQ